jgi:SAF domain
MATTTHAGDTAQDRRRAREERGVRSTAAAGTAADRLPPPPRERRPALAALAVLLIVGGAAVAGLLAMRADSRVPVLVAGADIEAGAQIAANDLTTTRVAAEGTMLVPASQLDLLVGQYAQVAIAAGQLIDTAMVTPSGLLDAPASVAVGATLAPGRMPAGGLLQGDIVDVVHVADRSGDVVVSEARVGRVVSGGTDGAAGATITLFVDRSAAPDVSAIAAAGELALVLIERGAPIATRED